MPGQLSSGAVNHVSLTVSDVSQSQDFYTNVMGFQVLMEIPPAVLLTNGGAVLGIHPPPDADQVIAGDRFNENRVGLDHLAFTVGSRDELEEWSHHFDQHGIPHGDITDLGRHFQLHALFFRDPDNIQLELTAPY